MNPPNTPTELLSATLNRRGFLRRALATGAGAAILPSILSRSASAQTTGLSTAAEQDYFVLSFALNLEYLEANFYSLATLGKTLAERGMDLSGFGTAGTTVSKSASTIVPFVKNGFIEQYGEEITSDETAHVIALRAAFAAAGLTPPAQPEINLVDSFNTLAVAAKLGDSFDPYSSQAHFLIGGFIFEDVGVTAYHGAAPLLTKKYLPTAAGILAVEGYHAAILRTKIFETGPSAQEIAFKISALRQKLSTPGINSDQGVTTVSTGKANIVPTNDQGIAFARTGRQVLNIVYGDAGASKGLFFPNGMNLPAS